MNEQGQLPEGSSATDIAIVGLAGRFPGARDVRQFWENLRDGVESATLLTDEQLRASGVPEELIADPDYVRACFPMPDMDAFDAKFFGFAPRDAAVMDPQQRHFLELAWTAMEHAGHSPDRFSGSVGVFAGCGASTYLMFNLLTNRDLVENVGFFLLRHTGNDKDFLATRASYLMNLCGPSVNVQTACSTSLVATHLAMQSLLNHECDLALAGGSTVRQPHEVGYLFKEGEIMSRDGHCRAFDERSEGTVFGSGAGVLVLRRLEDAIRGGDTIHAVIKGSAINNDGARKIGYLAPSVDGQAQAITEALGVAGVDPETIQYVECHGTGTPVGDPIEVTALTQAFRASGSDRKAFCAIGSLKSNVGHLDTAAGVASVIKIVESMKHRVIPASLHYSAPNPAIDFVSSPFFVNAEKREWTTEGGPRRAGVSSLGAGGTNAHVILEEAPATAPSDPSREWQLYVLSAKTPTALDRQAANMGDYLAATDAPAADVAFTLADGRMGHVERRFVVAKSAAQAAALLASGDPKQAPSGKASERKRRLAFMFAGGGAQHPGMGADLYEHEPVYRAAVDECIALLQPRLDWDLKRLLLAPPADRPGLMAEMERPSRSLPSLFITQYAMAMLARSWGIVPDTMIGHSMGEYTAAHLAGVFSLADGLALVSLRGQLFEKVAPGGMLSVSMSAADLTKRLPKALSIAAINAPELCVASGPVDALEHLEQDLAKEEIDCRRIHINIAAHSSMLEPILKEFGDFFRGIALAVPTRGFVSNVTGTWITAAEAMSGDYWVRHLRNTVQFADGVGVLLADEATLLLEVGPGRTLTTLASLHSARRAEQATVSSMRHPDDPSSDVAHALGMVGRLWMHGLEVDWPKLWAGERRRRVPLPTYPFEHQSYFIRPGKAVAASPGLARKADVGEWFWSPSWTRASLPPDAAGEKGRTLVFCDESGVSRALATRLATMGPVITVMPGLKLERRSDDAFVADPSDLAQMGQLVTMLGESGGVPRRIVHAWNAGASGRSIDEVEARAFYSLLGLLQGIAAEGIEDPLQLDVVTAGAHRVGGEATLEPRRALVLGPVRVAGKELPNVRARHIDIGLPDAPGFSEARVVTQLAREIVAGGAGQVIAWRGGDRYVQGFTPLPLPAASEAAAWVRDGAVCVLTGGLGGLGMLVAEALARSAKVRLVLVGRGAPTDGGAALRRLEALGAQVMAVRADVSDAGQLAAAFATARQRFGPVTHLIHAAGVVEDALIAMKDRASATRVLAPKVRGTLALAEALRDDPLERVVLFSSRGAVAGVAGQVDYTAASAFLDAWAERQSSVEGVEVLSIDWSAWHGVGLAAALTSGASAPATGRDAGHPLVERCVKEEDDEVVYQSSLGIGSHWLLEGHRIRGGEALIPGTGYLEIVRAAAEERAPMRRLEIRDVFFIAPFMVHGDERREMRVTLEGTGEYDVVVEGRSSAREPWEEHARAVVTPLAGDAPARQDPAAIRARCDGDHLRFTGNETREHLVLGRRWSNISALDFGKGEALATLRLPDEFRAETETFRLHPALLDVATACAQALNPGYDPKRDFFIPVSYGRVRVWETLAGECLSHIRLQPRQEEGQNTAVYDVTLMTPTGEVLVEISDFTMMRVSDRVQVGHAGSAKDARPLQFREGIKPEEGLDAFRRLVASGVTGQVVVSPQDLGAYLVSLTAEAAPATAEPKAAPEAPPVDVSQIEAVLSAHEAIHQVVVTAHRERTGAIRITAFTVFALGEQATISEMRRFLRGKLPDEMIPQHLVELEDLPLDKDGMVDRPALPDPFAGADEFVGPRTEMESAIAKIWIELLGVPRVSVYDNFLDVGGHSLLAMRAVSRIAKQTTVRLNPSVMTLHTLEQIAAECAARATAGASR